MKIVESNFFTSNLERMRLFYQDLGFATSEIISNSFFFQCGWSKIIFSRTALHVPYHYCFLIPGNTFHSALKWLNPHVDLIPGQDGNVITHFESWNADSIYFYDSDKNVVELIVRHDLQYATDSKKAFHADQIICLNEIGIPTFDIEQEQKNLAKKMGTKPWKGNNETFGTHGDQEGLILLPNPGKKKHWYPTDVPVEKSKVKFRVLFEGTLHEFTYEYAEHK